MIVFTPDSIRVIIKDAFDKDIEILKDISSIVDDNIRILIFNKPKFGLSYVLPSKDFEGTIKLYIPKHAEELDSSKSAKEVLESYITYFYGGVLS